jgi:hypothetical protein
MYFMHFVVGNKGHDDLLNNFTQLLINKNNCPIQIINAEDVLPLIEGRNITSEKGDIIIGCSPLDQVHQLIYNSKFTSSKIVCYPGGAPFFIEDLNYHDQFNQLNLGNGRILNFKHLASKCLRAQSEGYSDIEYDVLVKKL